MKKVKAVSGWIRNKKRSHLVGAGVFMAVFAVIGVAFLLRSFAAPPEIYLNPSTVNVQTGNDFTVTLRVDPGTPINTIDASIAYDETKLQFKSFDGAASAFAGDFIKTAENGNINVVRYVFNNGTAGTVSSDSEVIKITFTAIGTTSGPTTLTVSGDAAGDGEYINASHRNTTVNITGSSTPTRSASFTIEPSVTSPSVGSALSLRVYADSTVNYQGGQVTVNLPSGLAYTGTLNTTGTAFNPASTVPGTNAQTVILAFVTQSTTLTGKQLIATIPVNVTSSGAKSVTFSSPRLTDNSDVDITPITSNAFNITVADTSIPNPTVNLTGGAAVAATQNITALNQSFTISNFDAAATYAVTLDGQTINMSNNTFSIPASTRNGNRTLQVSVTKGTASGGSSYNIRLRNPNVNRTGCVDLDDLLVVNRGYNGNSTELDLDFSGPVGLADLMLVISAWGSSCI